MLDLIVAMWLSYKNFVRNKAINAAAALENQNRSAFLKEFGLMVLAILAPVAGSAVLFLVAYQARKVLIALAMVPVLVASYRVNHATSIGDVDDGDGEQTPHEKALELYPIVLRFVFQVMTSASSSTIIDRQHDMRDIMVTLTANKYFSMKNGVAIYPFEVDTRDKITQEQADQLQEELQRIGRSYIGDFPQLISTEAGREDPFEVLTVQPIGKRIHVDVVLRTSASIPIITRCRKDRASRMNNPTPIPRYTDPIYGEEEDGTDNLLR